MAGSRAVLAGSFAFLLVVAVFPRLSTAQFLLLSPAFASLTLVAVIATLVLLVVRSETGDPEGRGVVAVSRQRHALRKLVFTTPSAWSAIETRQSWETNHSSRTSVHRLSSPGILRLLDKLFDLIKEHYIQPWYARISPSPAFPNAVEVLIRQNLSEIIKRAEVIDWADLLVSRLTPLVADHFRHFRSIEHLSSSAPGPTPNPALPLPLPAKAHPALASQSHAQQDGISPAVENHLRGLIQRLLNRTMAEHDQKAEVVDIVVREVVLGAVAMPMFEMLCDGDFWNRQIDDKGGRYLHEQKQVDKLLSAISTIQQPTSPVAARNSPHRAKHAIPSSITANSTTKQFDTFLKSIPKLKTLGEARRLRADIDRELRLALQKDKIENGDRLQRNRNYISRLDRAKVLVESRISVLSGQQVSATPSGKPSKVNLLSSSMTLSPDSSPSVNLYAVLSDPSSLAFWLEFMERRGRSRLVQFWLTIEGFKDPLEAVGQDSALDNTNQSLLDSLGTSDNRTILEDAAFLHVAYIADQNSVLDIPTKHQIVIRDYANAPPDTLTTGDVLKIKNAVFSAQKAVYDQMEVEDWAEFRKSELHLKAMANLERPNNAPRSTSNPTPTVLSLVMPTVPIPTYLPRLKSPPPVTRQTTAPALLRSPSIHSPPLKSLPTLVNGNFAPANTVPSASISTTPPTFDRVVSDSKSRKSRLASEEPENGVPLPTPQVQSSSQLDFLMSSEKHDERSALFGNDEEAGGIDANGEEDDFVQVHRMEAIQAALNEIIAGDIRKPTSSSTPMTTTEDTLDPFRSPSASMVLPGNPKEESSRLAISRSFEDLKIHRLSEKPRTAPQSRNTSSSVQPSGQSPLSPDGPTSGTNSGAAAAKAQGRHLFDDEVAADDEAVIVGDDEPAESVLLAAPGNLQLSVEIARLQDKIQELVRQEHLLDTLIRQAELTGNKNELRLLQKSHSSVRREQRTCIFQKAQFEQQEEENRLIPTRTKVTVPSSIVTAEDGKQIVRYSIEVKQMEEGRVLLGWIVARRYNEFFELDRAIREWIFTSGDRPVLDEFRTKVAHLPSKMFVPILSASAVESRRIGLEKYIQSLVSSTILCDSPLLRAFLSRSPVHLNSDRSTAATASVTSLAPHNIVKSLYKTMATSLDDALLGPSMLDLMVNTLNRQLTDMTGGIGGIVQLGSDQLPGFLPGIIKNGVYTPAWMKQDSTSSVASPTSASASAPSAVNALAEETGSSIFTAPITDLFIELFDLKENHKNNWLRRQAIVVILQQFLGSTIERKVRDTLRSSTSQASLERGLEALQTILFPDGERPPPSEPRSEQEKLETKISASKKLGLLIPDIAANMIGRGNARRAARRVFSALQDRRLNQQLILCILDEIFAALFPIS